MPAVLQDQGAGDAEGQDAEYDADDGQAGHRGGAVGDGEDHEGDPEGGAEIVVRHALKSMDQAGPRRSPELPERRYSQLYRGSVLRTPTAGVALVSGFRQSFVVGRMCAHRLVEVPSNTFAAEHPRAD